MSDAQPLSPGRIFSLASGYWQPCALHAAVKLAVFSHLGNHSLSTAELASATNTSERGLSMLLNALVAMDLLAKDNGLFSNTSLSAKYLDRNSTEYSGHIVMHHHHLVDAWNQLDQAVISGHPVSRRDYGEEQERESFQMGMFNLALAIAPQISNSIDLSGRRHLLDLGGGPGTHAIHFCLANPDLEATVFDLPTTRPFAHKIAESFGVSDRIQFAAGDFHNDPIPGAYDVAWLSQIIHSNSEEECRQLIAKTAAVLEPGAMIMIHDFFLADDMAGPLFPALFSLNMLLNNEGRSYSEQEVRRMLEETGFGSIERMPFQAPNDSAVIKGILGG